MIPDNIPQIHPFKIGALSLPADKVGGDFFDFIPRESGNFDFVIGDVTGHGLSAALLVAMAQATFRDAVEQEVSVPQILDYADRALKDRLRRRLFVAANYGHIDLDKRQVHLFNAAQQSFLYNVDKGELNEISVEGNLYPLGITGRGGYRPSCVTLGHSDMVVCCSDGITEALNDKEEMFGVERFGHALREVAEGEPTEIINHVFEQVGKFTNGYKQSDDLTLLLVKGSDVPAFESVVTEKRNFSGERRPIALVCIQVISGQIPSRLPSNIWNQVQREIGESE